MIFCVMSVLYNHRTPPKLVAEMMMIRFGPPITIALGMIHTGIILSGVIVKGSLSSGSTASEEQPRNGN
jgi:hypothetical protein